MVQRTPSRQREQVVADYDHSGIGILELSTRVEASGQRGELLQVEQVVEFVTRLTAASMDYPMVYALRRAGLSVCVPSVHLHLQRSIKPAKYTTRKRLYAKLRSNERFDVLDKLSSPPELLLAHVAGRCAGRYQAAILPLNVTTRRGGDIDHANMLYLDLRDVSRVQPYLFEPNGAHFAQRIGTDKLVGRIVRRAAELLTKWTPTSRLLPLVVLPGDGLQTLLGETIRERGKTVGHRGYPICAAIGYWLVLAWLTWADASAAGLDVFLQELWEWIGTSPEAHRASLRADVVQFIRTTKGFGERNFHQALKEHYLRNIEYFLANHFRKPPIATLTVTIDSATNPAFGTKLSVVVDSTRKVRSRSQPTQSAAAGRAREAWYTPVNIRNCS